MIYSIAYGIHPRLHDYSDLYEAIKSVGDSYIHPLESVWLVSVPDGVGLDEIYKALRPHFNKMDSFVITSFLPQNQIEGIATNLLWEWLRENGHRQ